MGQTITVWEIIGKFLLSKFTIMGRILVKFGSIPILGIICDILDFQKLLKLRYI